MLLDVITKSRQFGVYTFFLSCSVAEFHWSDIIEIVACQYGETLSDEQVQAMDWSIKVSYLKRNPATVDYIFKRFGVKLFEWHAPHWPDFEF